MRMVDMVAMVARTAHSKGAVAKGMKLLEAQRQSARVRPLDRLEQARR